MVAVEASKVLRRPKVSLRLFELKTIASEAFKVTAAEKKQWLKSIIEKSLDVGTDPKTKELFFKGDPAHAIKAIAELNKMDGDLAAQKKEVTGIIGITIDNDDEAL